MSQHVDAISGVGMRQDARIGSTRCLSGSGSHLAYGHQPPTLNTNSTLNNFLNILYLHLTYKLLEQNEIITCLFVLNFF